MRPIIFRFTLSCKSPDILDARLTGATRPMGGAPRLLQPPPLTGAEPLLAALQRAAGQPARPAAIQGFDFGAGQSRHVGLHGVTDSTLKIGEMPVAFREASE